MEPFVYTALPARVVFGSGTSARAGDEARRLGRSGALVLSTPRQAGEARALAARMDGVAIGVFAEAAMHTPTDVTERGPARARELGADCLVALGGGSTAGLARRSRCAPTCRRPCWSRSCSATRRRAARGCASTPNTCPWRRTRTA
jgi:maleylacetate reductase